VTSIDADRFPGLAQQWDGETSLFDYLLDAHGVRMQRANRTFAAGLAEPAEAEALQLRIGAAILEMRGLNVDQDGKPIALVQHRFRGDRVQFTVDLG
jgi:DNA-binding GntR family transcriptional regulator